MPIWRLAAALIPAQPAFAGAPCTLMTSQVSGHEDGAVVRRAIRRVTGVGLSRRSKHQQRVTQFSLNRPAENLCVNQQRRRLETYRCAPSVRQ